MYNIGDHIRDCTRPVITGHIFCKIQTESRKWNPITKKPDGELVTKVSYIVISKATNHSFEIEHKNAELL